MDAAMAGLPVWFKGLMPEHEIKAEVELGETPAVREQALTELRNLINDQHNFYSKADDLFLLRFLRTKKYNVQKAFKVLRKYYAIRKKKGGILTCKKPSAMRHILEMNFIDFAPYRLQTGSHVLIYLLGNFNLAKASAEDFIATMFLAGEMIHQCESSQVCGGTYIIDMKGLSFRHYMQLCKIELASLVIDMCQDSWPERYKGIHFVNEPLLLRAFWRLVTPMLKNELKDRFRFHGSDLNSLHAHIPKSILPEELGGDTGPFDNREFAEYFFRQDSFIEMMYNCGIVEKTTLK